VIGQVTPVPALHAAAAQLRLAQLRALP